MAEPTNTPPTGENPPAPASGNPTTNPPAPVAPILTQEVKVYDAEYVRDLRTENASYRTKAKEWETKATDLQTQVSTLQAQTQTAILRASVAVEATKLKIVDADAALALMDKSGIQYADDNTVSGVEDALKKLIETKTYLVSDAVAATPTGNPARDDGQNKQRSKMSYAEKTAYITEHGHEKYLALPN
jgi:hypothetical protein